ncbi:MAG: response regulator [bacterium]|nr:response regulator [bacterium]
METLLLVYNDPDFSVDLEKYLSEQGYDVTSVHDAELVEELAMKQSPNVIILDALLQKVNGFELCQRLKRNPRLKHIPLLMTSAIYIAEEDLKNGIHFGTTPYPILADRCLMKPFKPSDLLKQLQYLLGKTIEQPYVPQILIVDDEKDIRDLLRTTLERRQYKPLEVATGKACLNLLSSLTPDVILLDYKLPDVSGLDVLKHIRENLPDIGVVLMTAYGDEDLAIHAIEEHVDAYIRKPFMVESMLTLVSQTLERSRIKCERNQLIAQLRESNREVMRNYATMDHANQRLRELDQLKSEFLANVGHELRTPLNSIIGFTELLLQGYSGPLSDNQYRQLAMVLSSGNHLLRVLNDVIEVSMLNAGQISLKNEYIQFSVILDDVLHELRHKAEQKHLQLLLSLEQGLPDCLGSREKIKLVLYNLLDNSIKFSSSGRIKISALRASTLPPDDLRKAHILGHFTTDADTLLVSVADQGIGIERENFTILFDEFRQVDGSLTREYNGTGLGLAISRKLVELYGGIIWLDSQVGAGATFYFTVPLASKSN